MLGFFISHGLLGTRYHFKRYVCILKQCEPHIPQYFHYSVLISSDLRLCLLQYWSPPFVMVYQR